MSQWRNKIDIKRFFTDESNDEDVKAICEKLIPQLERILENENNRQKQKLDDDFLWEFSNLIEEFKWIKESIEKELDATEYSFDDWTEAFNEYLSQLYDLGDTVTISRGWGDTEKFLWVG